MIGSLRHRITIQDPPSATDTFGQLQDEWEDFVTVWGEVKSQPGREQSQGVAQGSSVPFTITIRHRDGIHSTQRILYDDKILSIASVIDPDGRRRFLQIIAFDNEG